VQYWYNTLLSDEGNWVTGHFGAKQFGVGNWGQKNEQFGADNSELNKRNLSEGSSDKFLLFSSECY